MEHKGNIVYNHTGVYYDSLTTVTGCDSIYELTLTVYPTYHFDTIKQTICASEAPYYWAEGQRDCANSGIYTARYSTVNGYDSIYVLINNIMYIIECKHQQVSGSVDEKIQTCDFKRKEYMKLLAPANIDVEYIYILDDWFRDPKYKDQLDYIISVHCQYYFQYVPLKKLGLPVPKI